jgi:hypothetical protein
MREGLHYPIKERLKQYVPLERFITTPTRIKSFTYFVREIVAPPDPRNRAWQKKRLKMSNAAVSRSTTTFSMRWLVNHFFRRLPPLRALYFSEPVSFKTLLATSAQIYTIDISINTDYTYLSPIIG